MFSVGRRTTPSSMQKNTSLHFHKEINFALNTCEIGVFCCFTPNMGHLNSMALRREWPPKRVGYGFFFTQTEPERTAELNHSTAISPSAAAQLSLRFRSLLFSCRSIERCDTTKKCSTWVSAVSPLRARLALGRSCIARRDTPSSNFSTSRKDRRGRRCFEELRLRGRADARPRKGQGRHRQEERKNSKQVWADARPRTTLQKRNSRGVVR